MLGPRQRGGWLHVAQPSRNFALARQEMRYKGSANQIKGSFVAVLQETRATCNNNQRKTKEKRISNENAAGVGGKD